MNALGAALLLSLPLVISGTLHMLVVRFNLFARTKVPLSTRLFGSNKTWRGFLVMPLATVLGVYGAQAFEAACNMHLSATLQGQRALILGVTLGLAYVLAELPNSFVKRRLGIAPGQLPAEKALLFAFVDQADSAIGCSIAYAVFMPVPPLVLALLVMIGPVIHLLANVSLYLTGVRARPV